MAFAENFEDLKIWQEARKLVKEIYVIFSRCNDYAFCTQIQRASISIMNNISEGFGRKTKKVFAHFLDLAKGSCCEVKSMTYAAEDLNYLSSSDALLLRDCLTKLTRCIGSFSSRLRQQLDKTK